MQLFAAAIVLVLMSVLQMVKSECHVQPPQQGEDIQWNLLSGEWYSVLTSKWEGYTECVRLQNFQKLKTGFRVGAQIMTLNPTDSSVDRTSKTALRFDQAKFGIYSNRVKKSSLKKAGGKDLRETMTYRTDYENYIISHSCDAYGEQNVIVYTMGRHPSSHVLDQIQIKLEEENITVPLYMSACPLLHEIPVA